MSSQKGHSDLGEMANRSDLFDLWLYGGKLVGLVNVGIRVVIE